MALASRQELLDYCIRRLGSGAIDINVTEEQLNDRLDDVLQFVQMHDSDMTQQIYLKRAITANEIFYNTLVGNFIAEEWVISSTTQSKFQVYQLTPTEIFSINIINGDLQVGETITGEKSGATAVVTSVVIGDTALKSIPVPENVIAVNRVLNFSLSSSKLDLAMFQAKFMLFQNMYSITDSSILYYSQMQTQLSLFEDLIGNNKTPIRFNRYTDRVYLDTDWSMLNPGDYVVLDCYAILDPAQFSQIWDDMNIKRLCTAYIKRQWGSNLGKFAEISLPGGVKLRGGDIFNEAELDIEKIEADIQARFEIPAGFFTG